MPVSVHSISPRTAKLLNDPVARNIENSKYYIDSSQTISWPWQLKRSRQIFEIDLSVATKDLVNLDIKKQDLYKRHVNVCLRVWSRMSFVLGIFSAAMFIVSNEVAYQNLSSDPGACFIGPDTASGSVFVIYLAQALISASTALLLYCRGQFYYNRYLRRLLFKKLLANVTFWHSDIIPLFSVDFALCAIHCPPSINNCFTLTTYMGSHLPPAIYSIQLLNLATLFRVVLVLPFILYNSRFETPIAKILTKLYGLNDSKQLGIRDFISSFPATSVIMTYTMLLFVFAYFMLCFERPVDGNLHFQPQAEDTYWRPTYATCLWFVWAVQSTVGLGDWYPLTVLGRIVAIAANTCGMVATAMLIATVISKFTLSAHEQQVRMALAWTYHARDIPVAASSLIALWYRSLKSPAWEPNFSRAQLKFRRLRQYIRAHHPGDGLTHVKEMVGSIRIMEEGQCMLKDKVDCIAQVLQQMVVGLNLQDSVDASSLSPDPPINHNDPKSNHHNHHMRKQGSRSRLSVSTLSKEGSFGSEKKKTRPVFYIKKDEVAEVRYVKYAERLENIDVMTPTSATNRSQLDSGGSVPWHRAYDNDRNMRDAKRELPRLPENKQIDEELMDTDRENKKQYQLDSDRGSDIYIANNASNSYSVSRDEYNSNNKTDRTERTDEQSHNDDGEYSNRRRRRGGRYDDDDDDNDNENDRYEDDDDDEERGDGGYDARYDGRSYDYDDGDDDDDGTSRYSRSKYGDETDRYGYKDTQSDYGTSRDRPYTARSDDQNYYGRDGKYDDDGGTELQTARSDGTTDWQNRLPSSRYNNHSNNSNYHSNTNGNARPKSLNVRDAEMSTTSALLFNKDRPKSMMPLNNNNNNNNINNTSANNKNRNFK